MVIQSYGMQKDNWYLSQKLKYLLESFFSTSLKRKDESSYKQL